MKLPAGFPAALRQIHRAVESVDGWLTERELCFLALLSACPTTRGAVLEIGSYRGRSTIVLALAARLTASPGVVAVDPLPDEGPLARDASSRTPIL